MFAKTFLTSAAALAVLSFTASMPASAQKAPNRGPAPDAAALAAEVQEDYKDMGAELGLKGDQQAAFDRYAQTVGKAAQDHMKWHEDKGYAPRRDRQARFEYRAEHQKFRAGQLDAIAGARAALVKTLNADQVALLDDMESGYRFAPCPRADGRGYGYSWRGPRHHRGWDGQGYGYGPGCGYGPGWGHGWGHGRGCGYGPGDCPWR